nr:UDP-galactose/UDP-glucose transporter 3 [Ipomoea trifida]
MIFMFGWSHASGYEAVQFCKQHPEAAWDILMYCLCGAFTGVSRIRTASSGMKRTLSMFAYQPGPPHLSQSPTAASMVTPFVPSSESDRVSRSNLGACLILQECSAGDSIGEGRVQAQFCPSLLLVCGTAAMVTGVSPLIVEKPSQ